VERAARVAKEILEDGLRGGVFSGAQAAWCSGTGRHVGEVQAGTTRAGGGAPIDGGTLFDVASLTKPFVASAAWRLAERGAIRFEEPLATRRPELGGTPQGGATIAQLLAHEAGFAPWAPLYESIPPERRGASEARASMLAAVAACPPASAPDGVARYSDLGFMALGALLERAAGVGLAEMLAAEVTGPLGLARTRFYPTSAADRPPAGRCAETGRCPWRGTALAGEVHDDNARAFGGVTGHAGLFSTAVDVARLGAAWLDALAGTSGWLGRDAAAAAVRRRPSGRALGFDLAAAEGSAAGARMGKRTFGHLGFTGCSLWIDPDAGCAIALLTNRVLMGDDLAPIRAFRPRFQDAVMGALFEP
jgi:CubicO group peptidase (beta-lactamase class C family)